MEEATTPVCVPQGEGKAEQKPVPCERLTGFPDIRGLKKLIAGVQRELSSQIHFLKYLVS